jgi:hypothetical protein
MLGIYGWEEVFQWYGGSLRHRLPISIWPLWTAGGWCVSVSVPAGLVWHHWVFFWLAGTLVCSMVCLRKQCKAYAIDGDDAGGVAKTHILSLVAFPWALSALLVTSDPSELLLETPIR